MLFDIVFAIYKALFEDKKENVDSEFIVKNTELHTDGKEFDIFDEKGDLKWVQHLQFWQYWVDFRLLV